MRVHIALEVRDLGASRAFYETFLGLGAFRSLPGYVQFLTPDLNLALSEAHDARALAGHFGLEAASAAAVEAALARVRASGMAVDVESDVACCYARQDKFWVVDPDANRWEIFYARERLMDAPAADAGICCQPA